MQIDDDTKNFIKLMIDNKLPKVETLSPMDLREMRASAAKIPIKNQIKIRSIKDSSFQSKKRNIKFRIYSDQFLDQEPLIIFFHGGGFVMGNLDSHDLLCRHLCKKTKCKVIAIDYSLAPENKFPNPLEDVVNSVKYIFQNSKKLKFNDKKVIVCGDSAGGNFALIISILSKEKKIPLISGQVLFYPWVDFTLSRPSMDIELEGLIVTKETLMYFANHYLKNDEDRTNWKISPLFYPDFSSMPTTYIYTAGLDPLRDEGYALYKRLLSWGNKTYFKNYEGQMHAFVNNIIHLPTSLDCIKNASKAIKEMIK